MEGSAAAGVGLMRDLETVDLGQRGVAYTRRRLAELTAYSASLKVMCEVLEGLVSNLPGVVTADLPRGLPAGRCYEFDVGGVLQENVDPSRIITLDGESEMMPIEGLFDEECARIRERLNEPSRPVCIVVDPMPRKGDPSLSFYKTLFFVGDEAYHLITAETSVEDMDLALSASPFWSDLFVVTTRTPGIEDDHIDLDNLRECAAAAIEISCSAYDGEGFVVWRRV